MTEIGATGWPTYGGQPSGTQYSALDQINIHTVDRLAVAWTYHTGELSWGTEEVDMTVNQATPHWSVMFGSAPASSNSSKISGLLSDSTSGAAPFSVFGTCQQL